MDQELERKVNELSLKVDAVYKSVEKTRKYFLTMVWITVIAIVLPIIGLMFVIPTFISNYTSTFSNLSI